MEVIYKCVRVLDQLSTRVIRLAKLPTNKFIKAYKNKVYPSLTNHLQHKTNNSNAEYKIFFSKQQNIALSIPEIKKVE